MRIIVLFFSASLSLVAHAQKNVLNTTVEYVYQRDTEPTVFEFRASIPHGCGGGFIYRVESPSEAVTSRKFALVLAAFTAGKKLSFYDTEQCNGSRSIVSWVRIVNNES